MILNSIYITKLSSMLINKYLEVSTICDVGSIKCGNATPVSIFFPINSYTNLI